MMIPDMKGLVFMAYIGFAVCVALGIGCVGFIGYVLYKGAMAVFT